MKILFSKTNEGHASARSKNVSDIIKNFFNFIEVEIIKRIKENRKIVVEITFDKILQETNGRVNVIRSVSEIIKNKF